jgi:hypothetical protein
MWTQLYGRCLHTEKHDSHPDIAPVICRGFVFFAAFETAMLSACRTNSAPEPNWRRLASRFSPRFVSGGIAME